MVFIKPNYNPQLNQLIKYLSYIVPFRTIGFRSLKKKAIFLITYNALKIKLILKIIRNFINYISPTILLISNGIKGLSISKQSN